MAACLVTRPQHMGCVGQNRSTGDNRQLLVQTRMLAMWMESGNMRAAVTLPPLKMRASQELDRSLFLFLMSMLIKLYFEKKKKDKELILS